MGNQNNNNRIAIRTSVAVIDTDGYPKTELYFDSYEDGKCYRREKEIVHESEQEVEAEETYYEEGSEEPKTRTVTKIQKVYESEFVPDMVLEIDPIVIIEVINI